jgi:hypothetical protein
MKNFLHVFLLLWLSIASCSYAQERLCSDGKRSYFGVCPQELDSSRPLPPSPNPREEPRPTSQPQAGSKFKILPGVGLSECSVGMDASCFLRRFGGKMDGAYMIAYNHGASALISDGKIKALFFYFSSKNYNVFDGSTDRGIDAKSSPSDVKEKYGQPDRIGQSVVSQYGSNPGAQEISLEYRRLGIWFTFHDGRLADIRTLAKL